jgi:hypothetical protein
MEGGEGCGEYERRNLVIILHHCVNEKWGYRNRGSRRSKKYCNVHLQSISLMKRKREREMDNAMPSAVLSCIALFKGVIMNEKKREF